MKAIVASLTILSSLITLATSFVVPYVPLVGSRCFSNEGFCSKSASWRIIPSMASSTALSETKMEVDVEPAERSGERERPPERRVFRSSNPNNNFNGNANNNNGNNSYRGGSGGGGGTAFKLTNPMKLQRKVEPMPETQPYSREPRQQQDRQRGDQRDGQQSYQQRGQRDGGQQRDQRDGQDNRRSYSANSSTSPTSRPNYSNTAGNNNNRAKRPVISIDDDKTITTGAGADSAGGERRGKPAFGAEGDKDALRRKRAPANKEKRKTEKFAGDDGRNTRAASLRVGTGKKGRAAEKNQRRGSLKRRNRASDKEAKAERALERRTVALPDGPVSVAQLAELLDEKPVAVIKFLMTDLGVMASMTQSLDPATCVAVVEGFGKIVGDDEDDDDYDDDEWDDEDSALELGFVAEEDDPEDLLPRPPVVTIMGHVDHGKTSLLDAIRNTRVTATEAGGITQHIAAYQVDHRGNKITFIDTPGHAAFTDMRERGANITDLVILVVAADDGVKQQTVDSIMCARQAGVPLIVAINKCDLDAADPMKVMTELTGYELLTEDFGGDVLCSQISAKEGTNLDDLLDKVMLQAELQDLKANPDRNAEGIVIEAYVEKGLGTVATTLIKKGTLQIGDIFVAGETYGRVRALVATEDGKTRLDEAGPSSAVRVVGFEGVPNAGDALVVCDDEQTARELAESRQRIARERQSSSYQANLMSSVAMTFGAVKQRREMCVVVKADVQGSAEALTRSLRELKLENDEAVVTIKVLVSEAGEVTKSDIAIASVTPGTVVLAFNVAASYAASEDARMLNVPIEYYNIVYDAIESVESRMQEVLSPTPDGEYTGSALVQQVFNIGGTGNIAGCRCSDGYLRKGANVRVMRGDKILIESKIRTLRNFKAEADQIEAGNECGVGLTTFEDYQPGDVIECYVDNARLNK